MGYCQPSQIPGRRRRRGERKNEFQLVASNGLVDLYPPNVQLPLPSSQTVNHVPVGLLYRTTGSPKVVANGLWPLALVTRLKVVPPSVEHRYAREVAKVGASRIVESDDDLIGIIGVGRGECLRLRRVGERVDGTQ